MVSGGALQKKSSAGSLRSHVESWWGREGGKYMRWQLGKLLKVQVKGRKNELKKFPGVGGSYE